MIRYSFPRRQRVLGGLRRCFNVGADSIRKLFRRPDVLVVTGDASPAKVREVEVRLRFLFVHVGQVLKLRRVRRASALSYVRNTAVVAVDAAAVPALARRHLQWVADLDYDTNMADGWDLVGLGDALTRAQRRNA